MMYVIKFSNGLYLIDPYCAYGDDSVDGVFTTNLNKARLMEDPEAAQRVAELRLASQSATTLAGCTFEIKEVRVVEV